MRALVYAYGGVILGANADTNPAHGADVLRGIQFGPGGVVQPFPYGTIIGTSAINFTGGNPGLYLSVFVDANYGRSGASFHTSSTRDTTVGAVLIRRDNPFLPAAVATIIDNYNATLPATSPARIASFSLGRQNNDFGQVRARNQNTTERIVSGVEGKFGGGWSFDAYYEYGRNVFDSAIRNLRIEQNYRFAIAAVALNGQLVCRDATARANGCQPINLFGEGSPSAAAIAYANGTALYEVTTTQQVASANVRGEPVSTWAGPVAIAFGAEYRK